MDVTLVIFGLTTLLFSGIFHEQAHARVALWLGDPTARDEDRLSWNPKHHIDPWMSIALPAILLITSGGRFWFGGMKPVKIDANNFDNPTLGMALSAAAGPISNYLLATVGFLVLWAFHAIAPDFIFNADRGMLTLNGLFFSVFIFTNVLLGSFNLLPLPGLDGSRILYFFLPRSGREFLDRIEPYALTITMLAVWFGAAVLIAPVYGLVIKLLYHSVGYAFVDALLTRMWSGR